MKGNQQPVHVFEPVAPIKKTSHRMLRELARFLDTYQAYTQQKWDIAKELFTQMAETSKRPKLYEIYIERVSLLRQTVLPTDWDGTFTDTKK